MMAMLAHSQELMTATHQAQWGQGMYLWPRCDSENLDIPTPSRTNMTTALAKSVSLHDNQ